MCVALCNMIYCNFNYKLLLHVDAVTGILNRRCYDLYIENISSPVAIIMFDVDNFKAINDTYGHDEGDKCLERVAGEIKSVYGKNGSCYKIGGDEFCVILQKDINNIEKTNRQFKSRIAELNKKYGSVSDVALGFALYDSDKDNIQNVVKAADEMMYKNKYAEKQL